MDFSLMEEQAQLRKKLKRKVNKNQEEPKLTLNKAVIKASLSIKFTNMYSLKGMNGLGPEVPKLCTNRHQDMTKNS